MNKKKIIIIGFIIIYFIAFLLEALEVVSTIWPALIRYTIGTMAISFGFWRLGDVFKKRTKNSLIGSFIQVFPILAMLMAVIAAVVDLFTNQA